MKGQFMQLVSMISVEDGWKKGEWVGILNRNTYIKSNAEQIY